MSKSQITNRKWRIAKIIVFIIAVGLFFISNAATAETIDPQKIKEQRKKLEKELQEYEFQINRYQKLIEEKQIQATTMERDIAILNAKIDKLKLEIKARKIAIEELAQELAEKENSIAKLVKKSEAIKESLAELLRQVYEIEQNSLIELILNKEEFSDSFKEIDSLELAQSSLQDSLGALRISNKQLEEEKNSLEERQTEEVRLKITQELSTETIKEKEKEQKEILKITRGKEKEYQKFLKEQEKSAATIRSRLFLLAGSPAIPFEKAIEYANLAFNTTGVRPAFLLAVITEESNLGRNIGTGDWKEEMKKCPKQQTAFQEITQKLGLDPNLMPVSKRAWYGNCGGAMGPAQFMPTTWLLYENRIKNLVGEKPSPWNPKHAFLAAALYLKDVGAANGGTNSERTAALKYLAGSNWNKKAYSFYGNEVLEIASKYQKEIDIVKES
ncbi:MAG: hypothetical protein A3H02_02760 [Candidatus Niyogibacteria bacterium RIFCSPLOWO2_12_FULL_41_13]|uniref:Transglycosylase SLT domain-containing protein n=1 Tax=Candidatus Niyogibacteria bacterium RIFCSPLOWO2_12_FULL_41_13 TaxID=1801726 RepID=A0A1G2F3A7_9BACT|nr:MAG: hypothetical protein A3H02_02760 [Candidatus Niyogibacteria bacterium RIFCSPLOWO2_12_FULL_41_13]